ncbi:MAG: twin-arginine translocase TatA/TatE family subunit [Sphingomonadaceae bacterium]|nr:twin-arginine translocase TatA/TatE family subunit [Sphingomonadaceae bacterium]
MGGFSPIHIIIVLLLVVLLFGAGRVSTLMGDVAKGIKSFKKGMAEEDDAPRRIADERPLDARPIPPASPPPAEAAAPVTPPPAATPDPDRHA